MAQTSFAKLMKDVSGRQGNWRGSILPASRWLDTVKSCTSGGMCSVIEGMTADQWEKLEKDAEDSLTYCSDRMGIKEFKSAKDEKSSGLIAELTCVVTATEIDRDGDLLESKGGNPDPMSPFLWQHVPASPIGKWLELVSQDDELIVAKMGIVAMKSDLSDDAARLAEAGCLRISHGFDPKKYKPLKGGKGWHVEIFDILEVSLVSIPANKRAEILDFSWEKLKHPLVKSYYKSQWDKLPATVKGGFVELDKVVVPVEVELTYKNAEPCGCKQKKSTRDDAVSEKIQALVKAGKDQKQAIVEVFAAEGKNVAPFAFKGTQPLGRMVKSNGGGYVGCPYFAGSFEWITDELEDGAEAFLKENGVAVSKQSLVSVLATFTDSAVLCVQNFNYSYSDGGGYYYGPYENDFDEDDGYEYYRASWSGDSDPEWSGVPEKVELVAEARSFLKSKEGRRFMAEKAGAAVSRANKTLIKEAHDHFGDIEDEEKTTLGHKAMCKTAMKHYKDVMGGEGEEEKSAKVLSAEKIKGLKSAKAIGEELRDSDKMHKLGKAAAHLAVIKTDAVLSKADGKTDADPETVKPNPGVDGKPNPGMDDKAFAERFAKMPMSELAVKTLARIESGETISGATLLSLKETVDEAVDKSIGALAASF